nr:coat protein [Yam spherical virus]
MAMIVANNNKAMANIKKAGKGMVLAIGTQMIAANGKRLFWDGVSWVTRKIYNKLAGGVRQNGALVSHPGVLPGGVAAPVAISRTIRGSKPKFIRSKGSVTVSHREYVSQVQGNATGFFRLNHDGANDLYRINPLNSAVTPWLVNIASNFDQYRFTRLQLHYVPFCATTQVGRFAMFFDKDSEDVGPFDRAELANFAHLCETNVWAEGTLNIPVDNVKRFNNDTTVVDPKLIDLGRLGIVTYSTNTNDFIGDVFISYTVELFEAQPTADLMGEIVGSGATVISSRGMNWFTQLPGTSSNTTASFIFKPGMYYVHFICDGALIVNPIVAVVGGGAVLNNKVVFTATEASISATIDISQPSNRVDFNLAGGTFSVWDCFATKVSRSLAITTGT